MGDSNSFSKKYLQYYVLIIPALIFYVILFVFPVFGAFRYSLTDWDGMGKTMDFIGFGNYLEIFEQKELIGAIKNTFIYTFLYSIIVNLTGLALALVLNLNLKGKNFFRSVFYVPSILNMLVVGFIWGYIFRPDVGVLNLTLHAMGLDFLQQNWLGDPKIALLSILATQIWQWSGAHGIIYMAGLQTIPKEVHECSQIDGATGFKKLIHVVLPLIAPSVTINIMLAFMGGLKVFDIIYVMTKGGPGYATESITTVIQRTAFENYNFGLASTLGVFLFVIIVTLSLSLVTYLRSREVEL